MQTKKRQGKKPLIKEELAATLQTCLDTSRGMQEFVRRIQSAGLEVYERNGKAAGIVHNRTYRFATVGITDDMLLQLRTFESRQQEMEALTRSGKGYDRER